MKEVKQRRIEVVLTYTTSNLSSNPRWQVVDLLDSRCKILKDNCRTSKSAYAWLDKYIKERDNDEK